MTIRFVQAWNGYYPGQIVTSPNGGQSEATLISLGYAVADLDGPDNSPVPVFAQTNNVTGGIEFTAGSVGPIDLITHLSAIPQVPLVLFGDSRIAQQVTETGNTKHINARGVYHYLQILSGGAFDLKNVAGVSGNTTAQALARFNNAVGGPLFGNDTSNSGVSPYLPASAKGVLITWLGINDIITGVTLATMQDNALRIIAKANALNCVHIWINEPPAGATQGLSSAKKGQIQAWNRWLLSQSVIVIDANSLAINPTSATYLPKANMMNDDAVHPANLFGQLIGSAIWAKISGLIQAPSLLPVSVAQVYSFDSASPQRQVLPLLQTNVAATSSGAFASCTGTMPTGCGFFGSGAATVVSDATAAAASGFGNVWQADITFASGSDEVQMNLPRSEANFLGGETVFGTYYIEVTGPAGAALTTANNLKTAKAQITIADGEAVTHIRSSGNQNTGDTALSANITGTLRTLPITLGAGVPTNVRNSLFVVANGAGGCRVKISRAALWAA